MMVQTYIYWLCVVDKQLQNEVQDEVESAEECCHPFANKMNKICGIVMMVYMLLLVVVSQEL